MSAKRIRAALLRPPKRPLEGGVDMPGSKSVTNRALLVAALAPGTSTLTGALISDDTQHMMTALRAMGVIIEQPRETTMVVTASGILKEPQAPLFLGNAGTAVRFLTAAATLVDGKTTVTGDDHMQKRPIGPLIDVLQTMGVAAHAETGCPPIDIEGVGGFRSGNFEVDGSLSSQYVSALMMIAAMGEEESHLTIGGGKIGAQGYLRITAAVMEAFGGSVTFEGSNRINVAPGGYTASDYRIEPDASAATYIWGAEILTGGRLDIGCEPSQLNQPDAAAYDVIRTFPNMPAEIDGSQMQDAVPTLAVLAMYNNTPVRFVGIANLRVKECDRIVAVDQGISRINPGASTIIMDDLLVTGQPELAGAYRSCQIDTFDDHRIAMSFALAGLMTSGIEILNPDCVSKTFPSYWDMLSKLGVEMEMIPIESDSPNQVDTQND